MEEAGRGKRGQSRTASSQQKKKLQMSKADDLIEVSVAGEQKMVKVVFVDPFLFRMVVKLGEELSEVEAVDIVAGGKDISVFAEFQNLNFWPIF